MTSHTANELTGRMTCGGQICHENYEFIGVKGPVPTSAFGRGPDLYLESLDPTACGGHALRTVLGGCILELTRKGGPMPLSPPIADTLTEQPTVAASKSAPRRKGRYLPAPKIMIESPNLGAPSSLAMAGEFME
jgi:hypothetical protein